MTKKLTSLFATKAAARDYRDIVGEVLRPPLKEATSPSA